MKTEAEKENYKKMMKEVAKVARAKERVEKNSAERAALFIGDEPKTPLPKIPIVPGHLKEEFKERFLF